MKKILAITTSRADYGILKGLLRKIKGSNKLELYLIVSGCHLIEDMGYTVKFIEKDGFHIYRQFYIGDYTTKPYDVIQMMSKAFIEFSAILSSSRFDLVLVLGDRFELLPICTTALFYGVPVAHISGGETTEGANDEYIRHCITKLSSIHFPANDVYRKRIIQLGENPANVFNYGDIGVEQVKNIHKLDKFSLLSKYRIKTMLPIIVVSYHPTTLEPQVHLKGITAILNAFKKYSNLFFVFFSANQDIGGSQINEFINNFCNQEHQNSTFLKSIPFEDYISFIKISRFLIGNSSSGIVEAPSLGVPTINVGNRQKGRMMSNSIFQVSEDCLDIQRMMDLLLDDNFHKKIQYTEQYDYRETSSLIHDELVNYLYGQHSLSKEFFDIDFEVKK